MNDHESNNEGFGNLHAYILIAILAIIAWAILRRRQKEQQLRDIKARLELNKELDDALKKRMANYFSVIRWGFILIYLITNYVFLHFIKVDLSDLLNWNSVVFIVMSSLTFARFGDFNSYKKWWSFLETRLEVFIYKKSPELRKIISEDQEYVIELEKEIKELDFVNQVI